MKKKWLLFSIPFLVAMLFLAGCSNGDTTSTDKSDKINVYTTVYPLQYLAEQIGGDKVSVKSVYPPGSDAHSYEPTQKDMMNIADSDLFFYIGLGMEGFVDSAKDSLKNENVRFVATAEKLDLPKDPDAAFEEEDEDHEHEEDHEHGDINPHVWLDPVYMEQMATIVKDQLVKEMPSAKEQFEKNYQKVEADLKELDTSYRDMAEHAKRKDFVTAHAAYSYWETEYGLNQIPIAGISTDDEPSQKKLQQIVDTINEKNIPYIMLEQNTNSKIADVIQQETNTKTLTLHNLETLTQKDIDQNRDYMSIMEDNLQALTTALND